MRVFRTGLLLLLSAIHAALLWRAIVVGTMGTNDSASYVAGAAHRPPLYPLFLDLVELLPGPLDATLHIVQLGLGAAAIWLVMRSVHRLFSLDPVLLVALSLFLAMPYYRWQWLGNFLMSEALAYPLFLVSCAILLNAVASGSVSRLALYFAVATALFLTRKQFLFMFPIGFFVAMYIALRLQSWRALLLASGFTLAALGFTVLATTAIETAAYERKLPLLGMQLVPMPLYVLNGDIPDDLSPPERAFVERAWKRLDEREMTKAAFDRKKAFHSNLARHYATIFSTSTQEVVLPIASEILLGRTYHRQQWQDLEGAYTEVEAEAVNSFLLGVWKKLVLSHLDRVVSLYLDNIITHIGGSMVLLLLLGMLLSAIYFTYLSHSPLPAFLAVAILLHFGNFLFTGIFEPMYARYAFYTENLVLLSLLAFFIWLQRERFLRISSDGRGPVPFRSSHHEGYRKLTPVPGE